MAIPALAAMAVKHVAATVATDMLLDKVKGGSEEPKDGGSLLDKLIPEGMKGLGGAAKEEV